VPTFKVTIAYDGSRFVGWQRQAAGTSVQGLLEDVLRDLDNDDVAVAGAGRTDAGVHALGQVASFTLRRVITPGVLKRALNSRLPDDVRIVSAEDVPASFHARFVVSRKTYRYRIWNADLLNPFEREYAWYVTGSLGRRRDADGRSNAYGAPQLRGVSGGRGHAAFNGAGSVLLTRLCARRQSERRSPSLAGVPDHVRDYGQRLFCDTWSA